MTFMDTVVRGKHSSCKNKIIVRNIIQQRTYQSQHHQQQQEHLHRPPTRILFYSSSYLTVVMVAVIAMLQCYYRKQLQPASIFVRGFRIISVPQNQYHHQQYHQQQFLGVHLYNNLITKPSSSSTATTNRRNIFVPPPQPQQHRSILLSSQRIGRHFSTSNPIEDGENTTTTTVTEINNNGIDNNINNEKSPAELEAIQAARDARKAEKERLKAEKLAKQEKQEKQQQQQQGSSIDNVDSVIEDVTYLNINEQDTYEPMGDMSRIMSRSISTGRNFISIASLESPPVASIPEIEYGKTSVWICGRINSIRIKGGSCFLVIRQDSFHTIQCVYFKDKENPERSKKMIQYLKSLTVETVVQLEGTISGPVDVKSCTVSNIEIGITRIYAISKADPILPFLVEDASRSEQEVEESQGTDRPYPRLGQELRLDHRWMDLRTPANNAIMRIQSAVCQLFRESLYDQGFIEIHTPKLIAGESESGAGVFTTDYFGTTACLAQSPQLYKQMAIVSDIQRVFEIGPVFRAENSNTRRHLCEFTGLDLEMSIIDHYMETLTVVHNMFKHIFNGLETRWAKELAIIREQYASEPVTFTDEPCVIHWPEAMSILKENGYDMGDELQDLSGAMELTLGNVIKERYGTDFFMLDQYPSQIRPFYTMPSPNDDRYSNSYDMFIRGQEICSGAQRCHDPNLVLNLIQKKGIVVHDDGLLHKYIESFRHGVQPHAGAGIGLERVVFLYLGLDNVRKASMFPRDPNRCVP